MSDTSWQQICIYVLNDMFAIMEPFAHQSMDRVLIRKAVQIKVVPDCLGNPMCLCYVPLWSG